MITPGLLNEVALRLQRDGCSEATVAALRAAHDKVHFTLCSDDDIAAGKAVFHTDDFALYLVDAGSHCPTLTDDPQGASGIIVATIEE